MVASPAVSGRARANRAFQLPAGEDLAGGAHGDIQPPGQGRRTRGACRAVGQHTKSNIIAAAAALHSSAIRAVGESSLKQVQPSGKNQRGARRQTNPQTKARAEPSSRSRWAAL